MNMMTAKQKKAMKALAWISGCRDWSILTISSPPMMNMKAVSGREREGEVDGEKNMNSQLCIA